MSSATDETGSSSTATTIPPGDSSTSTDATSSSTGADACVTDTCTACFECTYDGECSDEQSLCSVDPACSVALICVRDCIAMSADPSDCLAACDCPKEGPLAALLGCATAICVPTGSCPPIAC